MSNVAIVNPDSWNGTSVAVMPKMVHLVPPAPWAEARVGKCYSNVQAMIARHGGDALYGWALTDFGPHRASSGQEPPPLYRRWLNHVVWRDPNGRCWEVTPNAVIDNHAERQFIATEFLAEPTATFEVLSDEEWFTRPSRYVPLRPEGVLVTDLLTQAQHAVGGQARNYWLREALAALQRAGFRPREWKVETIGERTGSIWLIAE
jgi:hypothetical protein